MSRKNEKRVKLTKDLQLAFDDEDERCWIVIDRREAMDEPGILRIIIHDDLSDPMLIIEPKGMAKVTNETYRAITGWREAA